MTYLDKELYLVLGDLLRDARDTANMTLTDAGNAIGVTAMTVQRYEKAERKATIETVRMLCDAYGEDPDELMQRAVTKFRSIHGSLTSSALRLSTDEIALLEQFRALNDDGKQIALNTLYGLVSSGSYDA